MALAAMGVMLLSIAVWSVSLLVYAPQVFGSGGGVLNTNFAASWAGIFIVMAGATALAAVAVRHGLSARPPGEPLNTGS